MDFVITENELAALSGLPHIQQLAYLRGIRPNMDMKTGVVGIKRGISLQSIAEQLYTEPHQGIKSVSYSRAQVRRALAGLERAGVISLQSEDMKLILNCPLASRDFSVQNKAVTPLIKDNIYIYLLSKFDQFWLAYPEKKSREQAWQVFQKLPLDESLFTTIMQSLATQIAERTKATAAGSWVPPWKYLANWLEKQCWTDEPTQELKQEKKHKDIESLIAEAILQNSGAALYHSEVDRAFYRPATDSIHLPPKH
ncbi:hypothetical protein [Legionella sp. CNM-4043-24]|uniref:hypothetical protein n=1 Tax=Legionella sp. CNM-4043-24 TaxID=3421646 RepID=UPI00403A8D76